MTGQIKLTIWQGNYSGHLRDCGRECLRTPAHGQMRTPPFDHSRQREKVPGTFFRHRSSVTV